VKATHYKLVNTRLQKTPETRPDSAIIQSFREQLAEETMSKEGTLAGLAIPQRLTSRASVTPLPEGIAVENFIG
jgi:hypothetical protein